MLQRLKTLLTRRAAPKAQRLPAKASPRVQDAMRVYALGDVHGRADLLADMVAQMKADAKGYEGSVCFVGMGDYINRGPASREVVELLRDLPEWWGKVFLRGNHEQAMLDFLTDSTRNEWLAWGGVATLESYGIAPYGARGLRETEVLAAELTYVLDETGHKGFYDATVLSHCNGDYAFVHAGVRPRLALEQQLPSDLLFIRDDFMGRPHGLPQKIVFGHTIMLEVLLADDRIGLDTGAYQRGVLSGVVLEGETVRVLMARGGNA